MAKVSNIETMAWNDHRLTIEGEQANIIIVVKDQNLRHMFKDMHIGYDISDNLIFPGFARTGLTVEDIAELAHEVNRSYCDSIGDNSQLAWDDAPEWQRLSAINGVKFHIENPNATPSASHDNWLKQKEDEGWKYGPVKNAETKEHPCFLPFDQLPVEQRTKDYLFRQVVHSMERFIR